MEKFAERSYNETTTATTAAAEAETKAEYKVSQFCASDFSNHLNYARVLFRKSFFYPRKY